LLFATVAVGLVARKRWRLTWFFDAYVGLGLVVIPMMVLWPHQFYRQWFVLGLETIASVFKFGIAIEVAWRTFRPFPGARVQAFVVALGILVVTAIAATAAPMDADPWEWEIVAGQLFPRVKTGTLWLMAAILILAHWYHVPTHPFHATVLTSFVLYLGVTSAILWVQSAGVGAATYGMNRGLIDLLPVVVDLLAECYWAYAAWRPDTATVTAHDATLQQLENGLPSCG
jgi:hypothetical protein